VFDAKVIDVSEDGLTIEGVGERYKVEALLRLLQPFGIRELARAGTLAIGRLPPRAVSREEKRQAAG
jgi:acetolactate synthase-1/3 small subunit